MKELFARTATLVVCLLYAVATTVGQSSTASKPEDLIKQVLTALEMRDQAALEKLTITQAEYKKFVWPNVAARGGGGKVDANDFYDMYRKSSAIGIASNLAEFGGRKLQLVNVVFGPPISKTRTFRLLPAPTVTVKDENGYEKTVRLAGAVLEHDGSYKVSTYYVTPTQAGK